jgi:hypothetical protein
MLLYSRLRENDEGADCCYYSGLNAQANPFSLLTGLPV